MQKEVITHESGYENSNDNLAITVAVMLIVLGVLFVWFGIDGVVKAVEQLNG